MLFASYIFFQLLLISSFGDFISIVYAEDNTTGSSSRFLQPMQPGQMRSLPEVTPMPNFDFTIMAPHKSAIPRAVDDVEFDVKEISISGATAYSEDELEPFIAPLRNQSIHLNDLIAVAEKVEAKYRGDGYILTRAYVPTQNVSDGIFTIKIVEGYIAAISIIGGNSAHNREVETVLESVTELRPLQISALEQFLVMASDLPGVSVSGLLRPSALEAGASDLVVTVKEQPMSYGLSFDNRGTASTGFWTSAADVAFFSPFEDGGQFLINASTNPRAPRERMSGQVKYIIPLLWHDMTVSISASGSHGEPSGTMVNGLHMISNGSTLGPHFSLPLYIKRDEKITFEGGLTVQSSDAKGIAHSHDEWRVADLSLAWQSSDQTGITTNAAIVVAQGIPSMGATSSEAPDLSRTAGHTDFTKFTGTFKHSRPLFDSLSGSISFQGQFTRLPTIAGEEISYGGSQIGRGYDPGSISGDKGVGGTVELRYDIDTSVPYLDSLQPYAYYDAAKVWVNSGKIAHNTIMSVGGGIRMALFSTLTLDVQAGRAQLPVPSSEKGKRSSRVALNASIRF